jgi:hypothetical protein
LRSPFSSICEGIWGIRSEPMHPGVFFDGRQIIIIVIIEEKYIWILASSFYRR